MSKLYDDLVQELPIETISFATKDQRVGLVLVDIIHGFVTPNKGALSPDGPDSQVEGMVKHATKLATRFAEEAKPILAFLDTHIPGKSEPPYPPHCEIGSGEEHLVPELEWLHAYQHALLIKKDCINGWIGAETGTTNLSADWIKQHNLSHLIVTGICTDICVMDLVLTLLSARNHDLLGPQFKDIIVYEPACATYDLPKSAVAAYNLPKTAQHPQDLTHHLGLYFMASRGAILAHEIH